MKIANLKNENKKQPMIKQKTNQIKKIIKYSETNHTQKRKKIIILINILLLIALIILLINLFTIPLYQPHTNSTMCDYNNPDKTYLKTTTPCVINFLCIKDKVAFSDNCGCGCKTQK